MNTKTPGASTRFRVRALISWARHYNRNALRARRIGHESALWTTLRDLNIVQARVLSAPSLTNQE